VQSELSPTDPLRLEASLQIWKFYQERKGDPQKAAEVAKAAFDDGKLPPFQGRKKERKQGKKISLAYRFKILKPPLTAISSLDFLSEDSYKDSTYLIQQLRDCLTETFPEEDTTMFFFPSLFSKLNL